MRKSLLANNTRVTAFQQCSNVCIYSTCMQCHNIDPLSWVLKIEHPFGSWCCWLACWRSKKDFLPSFTILQTDTHTHTQKLVLKEYGRHSNILALQMDKKSRGHREEERWISSPVNHFRARKRIWESSSLALCLICFRLQHYWPTKQIFFLFLIIHFCMFWRKTQNLTLLPIWILL